ncbi:MULTISPECIES: N2,N2-dimethylguanosine tRNA methyltransferase [Acidiplasma]|jgi:tRNA (guanine26-N2/guanine27-N2)-dimethyltransferase|uniref:tRNA (guanine(26)-N(2))-dimethyltransferase n=2 Tax=Acidiplasma TaxID=507753 RepID=A0A0Q0RRI3_9ARCH|nr:MULTISPECIES: N2,N2-dimethylguanosine tRNA methyltransferase [Acidiplasma]KQB34595.1 N2,N2-dimethylguanosine tRNA methyltransferase [Acidiplasma aeolicum]KQB34954.1 N2,N2-dimethylguanosine tRNA methyltransferase [Acidiplasma cupricumulans]
MERKNQFKLIHEGAVQLRVPLNYNLKGPGTAQSGFYNASQKLNRDITLSFLKTFKPRLALDAFGGTGVRGIRFLKEAGIKTVITELNRESFDIINQNALLNGEDPEVINADFRCVINKYLFDYIDIDPYGSVIPYIGDAIMAVKNRGYIGITATDLTALTGSMPQKTLRRYNAYINNDAYRHESGIRLLIASFVRAAAAQDKGAFPLISLWHSHYYRIIFKIYSSANKADEALAYIGKINKNKSISDIYMDMDEGPLWLGHIHGIDFNSLIRIDSPDSEYLKILDRMKNDDLSLMFLNLPDIFRAKKINSIKMEDAIRILNDNNIRAGRTQFSDTGIKADADLRDLPELLIS